ncbi:MAG: transglycosylase SLT domain-containing protein [Rhodobacteraceae bacterium]|nr:transglycosylase SLT domain-containing protein [Paracoccaceae bacterium]
MRPSQIPHAPPRRSPQSRSTSRHRDGRIKAAPLRRALPGAARLAAAARRAALLLAVALSALPAPAPARIADEVPAGAVGDPAAICEAAAREAAATTGVPLAVLMAISLTETGRRQAGRMRPWPWTVNMEGAGHWFADREAALAYVAREFARGARSFDVGCFQINYRWHGHAFPSVEAMFDPRANAIYAARFLARLHAEAGDWSLAAGAYHSRTPAFAERYRARFDRFVRALLGDGGTAAPVTAAAPGPGGAPAALPAHAGPDAIPEIPDIVAASGADPAPAAAVPRLNTWPLLTGAPGAGQGSLVPLGAARGPFLAGLGAPGAGDG